MEGAAQQLAQLPPAVAAAAANPPPQVRTPTKHCSEKPRFYHAFLSHSHDMCGTSPRVLC